MGGVQYLLSRGPGQPPYCECVTMRYLQYLLDLAAPPFKRCNFRSFERRTWTVSSLSGARLAQSGSDPQCLTGQHARNCLPESISKQARRLASVSRRWGNGGPGCTRCHDRRSRYSITPRNKSHATRPVSLEIPGSRQV